MRKKKAFFINAALTALIVGSVSGSVYWVVTRTGNVKRIGNWELVTLETAGGIEQRLFVAAGDRDGNPLSPDDAYTIEGKNTLLGEWSIKVVDGRQSLTGASGIGTALSSKDFVYEPDGSSYRVILARPSVNKNWLPMGEAEKPVLVISLNPSTVHDLAENDGGGLPVIKKIGDVRATARNRSER